jgi:hypothetical protein
MIKTFLSRTSMLNNRIWYYIELRYPWVAEQKKLYRLKQQARKRAKAIRIANLRHQTDGRRYYVLPDHRNRLLVLNNTEIQVLKKAGVMNRKVTILNLLNEAVYHTK